jgi:hypothetical protein
MNDFLLVNYTYIAVPYSIELPAESSHGFIVAMVLSTDSTEATRRSRILAESPKPSSVPATESKL